MTERPPLAVFPDEDVEAVAAEYGLPSADLADLARRHQVGVRELPGVEDIVYEWRSQFHQDPLVHRDSEVYVLALRSHVWEEFADTLDADGDALAALRALHDRVATSIAPGGEESVTDGDAMVLTRS